MVAIKRFAEGALAHAPDAKRKRIVHHCLKSKQLGGQLTALHPQDRGVVDDQLDRAMSVVLRDAGFDGVKPSALEMFRSAIDSFLRNQLAHVKGSMNQCRRTQPIPQDFVLGLDAARLAASSLSDEVARDAPVEITQAPLEQTLAETSDEETEKAQAILSKHLGGANDKQQKKWIPAHLPDFPSQHTYKDTEVTTTLESDTRRIREQSTQEGMLAEQALRRLMIARQRGSKAMRDRRRNAADTAQEQADAVFQDALNAMLAMNNKKSTHGDVLDSFQLEGPAGEPKEDTMVATDVDFGAIVNYDKVNWRKGAGDWVSAL